MVLKDLLFLLVLTAIPAAQGMDEEDENIKPGMYMSLFLWKRNHTQECVENIQSFVNDK